MRVSGLLVRRIRAAAVLLLLPPALATAAPLRLEFDGAAIVVGPVTPLGEVVLFGSSHTVDAEEGVLSIANRIDRKHASEQVLRGLALDLNRRRHSAQTCMGRGFGVRAFFGSPSMFRSWRTRSRLSPSLAAISMSIIPLALSSATRRRLGPVLWVCFGAARRSPGSAFAVRVGKTIGTPSLTRRW